MKYVYIMFFLLIGLIEISGQTVSGIVWLDEDGDGVLDGGEARIFNLQVRLFDSGNNLIDGPIGTNAQGEYQFNAVADGDYYVAFDKNAFNPTLFYTRNDIDSRANRTTGQTPVFTVNGSNVVDRNAGLYFACSVGDLVWEDRNGNGIREFTDGPLTSGPLTINLFLSGGAPAVDVNGNNVPSQVSANNYLFDNLPPGDYYISINDSRPTYFPTRFEQTGGNDDNNISPANLQSSVFQLRSTTVSGQNNLSIDIGVYEPVSIGDLCWVDDNGNGLREGAETNGVAGVTIQVINNATGTTALDGFGNPVPNQVSTAAGAYLFQNLPPGSYYLVFTAPATWFFTRPNITGGNTQATDVDNDSDVQKNNGNRTHDVVLESGDSELRLDAGLYQASTIGDLCWEDDNGNGLQDGGENTGVAGVQIQIIDVATGLQALDINDNPVNNQISAANGAYQFNNLPPGTYYLVFTEPANWFFTRQNVTGGTTQATDVGNDSDVQTNNGNRTHEVTMTSGSTENRLDAGLYRAGSIGDLTWIDMNGNGLQDGGEPPIGGVTVAIQDDMGNPVNDVFGNVVNPIVSGGNYVINNLPPGNYRLVFTAPANHFFTILNAAGGPDYATDSDIDSDVDITNGFRTHIINLSSGENETRVDAGMYSPATIGDYVFKDADANGIQEFDDFPLDNVQVFLETPAGAGVTDVFGNPIGPQVSNGAGFYEFDDVRPGEYRVRFVNPPMFLFSPQNQGGNPNLDSDPNPGTGNTDPFTVMHNQQRNDIDAGLFKQITVGGIVWLEGDNNGMFDPPGESGAMGVEVTIWTDPGGTGTPQALLATTFTDDQGRYEFRVNPGWYIIILRSGNFNQGGALFGTIPCDNYQRAYPPPYVQGDNNGYEDGGAVRTVAIRLRCGYEPEDMGSTNLTFDFCFTFDCDATSNPFSFASCEIAANELLGPPYPVYLCDIRLLDIGCATMPSTLVQPAPAPLCPSGGAPHNMSWFPFVAGFGNYQLQVEPTGCLPGQGGQLGVQAGIYTDCSFSSTPFCQSNCSTSPITIDGSLLTPGEIYYFFFDGCAGSVCQYNINILGNFIPYTLDEPTGLIVNPVKDVYCPGETITFTVENLDLNITYDWTSTPAANLGSFFSTDANNVQLTFSSEGTYTVCMTRATNICDETAVPACVEILVQNPPDEIFSPVDICEDLISGYPGPMDEDPNMDGLIGWQVSGFNFTPGINRGTVTTPDGCMYDQEIEIIELLNQGPELVRLAVCSDAVGTDYFGVILIDDIDPPQRIQVPGIASNGCDSLIDLEVTILRIEGELIDGPCTDQGLLVEWFKFGYSNPNYDNIEYIWRDINGNIISNTTQVYLTESGVYRLEIRMEKYGQFCSDFFEYSFNINDWLPPAPIPSDWQTQLCANENTYIYAVGVDTPDAILSYHWSYPADALLIGSDDGPFIILNWQNSAGGQVCVYVTTYCGEGPAYCANVEIIPAPVASFTATPVVCVDGISIVNFTGSAPNGSVFTWNFSGGTIVNGTGGNGPGPHHIVWDTEGDKTISLSISAGGCESNVATSTVEVITPVDPPILNCNPTLGEIEFIWDDISAASGYNVIVISGPSGTQMGNSYLVTGLTEGESVTIQIEAIVDDACGNVFSAELTCTSQNCDPPSISAVNPGPFCRDANTAPVNIMVNVNPPTSGTITFTGPGIVNQTTGEFDPKLANIGNNVINIRFVGDDDCVATTNLTIVVNDEPTADFTVSDNSICITETIEVRYTGNVAGAAIFTWTFDPAPVTPGTGPGPFNLQWNTPGVKNISLVVSRAGCTSDPRSLSVNVDPTLAPLNLACGTVTSTSVSFVWDDIANISGYNLLVDGMPLGTVNNTGYTASGLSPDQTVTLEVTALSNNNCPNVTQSITCQAISCPPINITFGIQDTSICLDGTAQPFNIGINVSGGLGTGTGVVTWSGPGVNNMGVFDPNVAGVGTHIITAIFNEANCSETSSITYVVRARPVASFTALDRICVTDDLILNFSSTPALTPNWIITGGASAVPVGGNQYSVQWSQAGTFEIRVFVDENDCVSEIVSRSVTVEPELEPITITCETTLNSVTFNWNNISCISGYEILIDGANVGTQSNTTRLVSGVEEGAMVTITVTGVSICECPSVFAELTCTARACPPVEIALSTPVEQFCQGTQTNTIQLAANVTGSSGSGNGTWAGNGINASNGQVNPASLNIGVNTFTYTFLDQNCTFSESISITVFENPVLTISGSNPNCYQSNVGTILVNVTGGTGDITYFLDGQQVVIETFEVVAPGSRTVSIRDANNCTDTKSVTIQSAATPSLTIAGITTVRLGTSTILTPNVSNLVGNVTQTFWYSGDSILCENCAELDFAPTEPTQVCVRISYNEGCFIEACVFINVQVIEDIVLPNILTPGSGTNGLFFVPGYSTINVVKSMTIFDRWGNKVYSAENFSPGDQSVGWNGKFNNQKDMVPGVYVYVVVMELNNDDRSELVKKGDITVLK